MSILRYYNSTLILCCRIWWVEQGARAGPVISQYLLSPDILHYTLTALSPGDYHGRLIKHLLHLEPPDVQEARRGESPGAWLGIYS